LHLSTQIGSVARESGDEHVRMWRTAEAPSLLLMRGTTSSYRVDPAGEYVMGVIEAGAMTVVRDRARYAFRAGDLCVFDPSSAHAGSAARPWSARLMVIEQPEFASIVEDPDRTPHDVLFPHPIVRDPRLAARFAAVHRALEEGASALARETLVVEWLGDLTAGGRAGEPARERARRDPALRRACELLADNVHRNVSLGELATAAGTSRYRLTRLFRAGIGLPPHQFHVAQRIKRARLLLERGEPISRAALATGFADQAHLHRHFKRTLGITPAAYVARVRPNVQDGRRAAGLA
jgi:AraC-like DNA-binding protein